MGEHPVKWLLETLGFGEGILEALWTWLDDEIIPEEIPAPTELQNRPVSRPQFSDPNHCHVEIFSETGRTM